MSATAALSVAFYLCLFVGMGLNLFVVLRYSQGPSSVSLQVSPQGSRS